MKLIVDGETVSGPGDVTLMATGREAVAPLLAEKLTLPL